MAVKEGRLSRWSRLKQKGGADEREEDQVRTDREARAASTDDHSEPHHDGYAFPDSASMPGGDFRRRSIPVMSPLGGTEDDDDAFQAPPPEALAMLSGEQAHDPAAPDGFEEIEVGELTPEEEEIVATLPPIESLTPDSDFTPFLADKVPEFLRRRAMSILWRSNPVFANLDGLNDYDEDFNVIDTLIDAATETNYRVGKGMPGDEDKAEEDKEGLEEEKSVVEADPSEDVGEGELIDEDPEDHDSELEEEPEAEGQATG